MIQTKSGPNLPIAGLGIIMTISCLGNIMIDPVVNIRIGHYRISLLCLSTYVWPALQLNTRFMMTVPSAQVWQQNLPLYTVTKMVVQQSCALFRFYQQIRSDPLSLPLQKT